MFGLKPHIYFYSLSIIILILGISKDTSNDILTLNIHDTYFVINKYSIMLFVLLIFIGFTYWTIGYLKINLNRFLTNTHIVLSIIGSIIVKLISTWKKSLYLKNLEISDYNSIDIAENFIKIALIAFLLAQILFIVNIIISTLKHGIQRTTSR